MYGWNIGREFRKGSCALYSLNCESPVMCIIGQVPRLSNVTSHILPPYSFPLMLSPWTCLCFLLICNTAIKKLGLLFSFYLSLSTLSINVFIRHCLVNLLQVVTEIMTLGLSLSGSELATKLCYSLLDGGQARQSLPRLLHKSDRMFFVRQQPTMVTALSRHYGECLSRVNLTLVHEIRISFLSPLLKILESQTRR